MAIEFMAWALEQKLPTGAKFVLVALCNRANQDGECWPSQKDLAAQTGMGERTVRAHIDWLCKEGVIVKEQRRRQNGSYTSDRFTIQRQYQPAAKSASGKKLHQPAAKSAAPEPSLNSSLRSELEPSKTRENPPWLDLILWEEFKKHRSEKRSKLTPTAETRAIAKLGRLREGGHDPSEVISQSLENGWTGLFEIKERKHEANRSSHNTGNRAKDALDAAFDKLYGDYAERDSECFERPAPAVLQHF